MLTYHLLTAFSHDKTQFCTHFSKKTSSSNTLPKIALLLNNILSNYCLKLFSELLDWVAKLCENLGNNRPESDERSGSHFKSMY